eukprot:141490-Prymnesium_polylepis.1
MKPKLCVWPAGGGGDAARSRRRGRRVRSHRRRRGSPPGAQRLAEGQAWTGGRLPLYECAAACLGCGGRTDPDSGGVVALRPLERAEPAVRRRRQWCHATAVLAAVSRGVNADGVVGHAPPGARAHRAARASPVGGRGPT